MECVFCANELCDAIHPSGDTFKKIGVENYKDWEAATMLYSVMPMDVLQHLIAKVTANESWDMLKLYRDLPSRLTQANLETLLRYYQTLVMGEDESVDAFTSHVVTLINRTCALGNNPMDSLVVHRFLRTAPC